MPRGEVLLPAFQCLEEASWRKNKTERAMPQKKQNRESHASWRSMTFSFKKKLKKKQRESCLVARSSCPLFSAEEASWRKSSFLLTCSSVNWRREALSVRPHTRGSLYSRRHWTCGSVNWRREALSYLVYEALRYLVYEALSH